MNQSTNILTQEKAEMQEFGGMGYCLMCGNSRTILGDMLHAKGGTRKTNADRKEDARYLISRCPACTEYFKEAARGR